MRKTNVFVVRKRYLCVFVSMNVNNLTHCSQHHKKKLFLILEPPQRWLHAIQCIPKHAPSLSQGRYEPRAKAIWRVVSTKDIVHTLFGFSNLIYYLT